MVLLRLKVGMVVGPPPSSSLPLPPPPPPLLMVLLVLGALPTLRQCQQCVCVGGGGAGRQLQERQQERRQQQCQRPASSPSAQSKSAERAPASPPILLSTQERPVAQELHKTSLRSSLPPAIPHPGPTLLISRPKATDNQEAENGSHKS